MEVKYSGSVAIFLLLLTVLIVVISISHFNPYYSLFGFITLIPAMYFIWRWSTQKTRSSESKLLDTNKTSFIQTLINKFPTISPERINEIYQEARQKVLLKFKRDKQERIQST